MSSHGSNIEDYRAHARSLGLPLSSVDEVIHILQHMIATHVDAAWGVDPVQLCLPDQELSSFRTQEEHAIIPPSISYIDVSGAADILGGEGQDSNES